MGLGKAGSVDVSGAAPWSRLSALRLERFGVITVVSLTSIVSRIWPEEVSAPMVKISLAEHGFKKPLEVGCKRHFFRSSVDAFPVMGFPSNLMNGVSLSEARAASDHDSVVRNDAVRAPDSDAAAMKDADPLLVVAATRKMPVTFRVEMLLLVKTLVMILFRKLLKKEIQCDESMDGGWQEKESRVKRISLSTWIIEHYLLAPRHEERLAVERLLGTLDQDRQAAVIHYT